MAGNWISLGKRDLLRLGNRLTVFMDHVRLPDGREIEDYLQFSGPAFAVIVAQTPDGRFLAERQYKHGARRVILTLPAGAIDPEEEPLAAAKRELLEETGYTSGDWLPLGEGVMHANAGGSPSHAFLARHCRKVAEPDSGDLEDMTIELKTAAELIEALRCGEMPLCSDIAAFAKGLLVLAA